MCMASYDAASSIGQEAMRVARATRTKRILASAGGRVGGRGWGERPWTGEGLAVWPRLATRRRSRMFFQYRLAVTK